MMTVVYWTSMVPCIKLNERLRDLKLLSVDYVLSRAENGSLLMAYDIN
jgi:hypothetical protein